MLVKGATDDNGRHIHMFKHHSHRKILYNLGPNYSTTMAKMQYVVLFQKLLVSVVLYISLPKYIFDTIS